MESWPLIRIVLELRGLDELGVQTTVLLRLTDTCSGLVSLIEHIYDLWS
jgi:hypothetical protein